MRLDRVGMYLGHFIAWMPASILYALQLHNNPPNTDVLPGPLAYNACGIAGLMSVWYRRLDDGEPDHLSGGARLSGDFPEGRVTGSRSMTGTVAAVAGMFPAVTMKLSASSRFTVSF